MFRSETSWTLLLSLKSQWKNVHSYCEGGNLSIIQEWGVLCDLFLVWTPTESLTPKKSPSRCVKKEHCLKTGLKLSQLQLSQLQAPRKFTFPLHIYFALPALICLSDASSCKTGSVIPTGMWSLQQKAWRRFALREVLGLGCLRPAVFLSLPSRNSLLTKAVV